MCTFAPAAEWNCLLFMSYKIIYSRCRIEQIRTVFFLLTNPLNPQSDVSFGSSRSIKNLRRSNSTTQVNQQANISLRYKHTLTYTPADVITLELFMLVTHLRAIQNIPVRICIPSHVSGSNLFFSFLITDIDTLDCIQYSMCCFMYSAAHAASGNSCS